MLLGGALELVEEPNRRHAWRYDRRLRRRRNGVERLFRRLRDFRRIFSRFEGLDPMFTAFIDFALIVEMVCVRRSSGTEHDLAGYGRIWWTRWEAAYPW